MTEGPDRGHAIRDLGVSRRLAGDLKIAGHLGHGTSGARVSRM